MGRVLAVDDDPRIRDLASRAISAVGLTCQTASNGQEASDRFDADGYDIVVTDLRMPGQHGYSLVTDLLNRPNPPSVVVMTGLQDPRIVRDLMGRGVADIFFKPFEFNVLALKLLSLMKKSAGKQATTMQVSEASDQQALTQIEKSLVELSSLFAESLSEFVRVDCDLSLAPQATDEFVNRYAKRDEESARLYGLANVDRRLSERVACPGPIVAVPVDRHFAATGDPFAAAIRDVSEGGIRLLHTRAIEAEYLAVKWVARTLSYSNICVAVKVARCEPLGPFYCASGEYVMAD